MDAGSEKKISPGRRKDCPKTSSAALALRSSFIIVFKQRMIVGKWYTHLAESNCAVKAIFIDLIARSAIPLDCGYRTLLIR